VIKLSDYVIRKLEAWGVRHIFMVTGGGAMHLNDSIGQAQHLRYVCTQHEQAAAMAAEAYARVTGIPGVVNVTTGPGGINALNGVFGAWTDSIPMLVISGQVKRETCLHTYAPTALRQLGDQEADIVRMVQGIAKYAVVVDDPRTIRYHLERAWFLARSGRPGPCWLDIPVDVQSAQLDESTLLPYDPVEDQPCWHIATIRDQCREIVARLRSAARPVIMAGSGVRLAGAISEFERVIRLLEIPVTTAWTHDIIASDDPLFCGRPGTIGERAGNFTVQNSDCLLVLGSRLNIRQVSYNWRSFARNAFKIQVDADAAEMDKPTVRPDLAVHSDLKVFLTELRHAVEAAGDCGRHAAWLGWCRERVARYPVVQERQRVGPLINPYYFVERLFAELDDDDVVICGHASACIVPFQVGRLRKGQRMFSNSGSASMGYDIPAALGAAVARGGKRVICLAGDGSVQLNIQELQTIVHHQLPVKIFVMNNDGYLSIRTTQSNFFGRLTGVGKSSGVSFPDLTAIARAYGIDARRVDTTAGLDQIRGVLASPGPVLCDVRLDPAQEFEPRLKSRQLPDGTITTPSLEDMYPFLDPEELSANLLVETVTP
jgi:acetolactate synthase-1/2/3 large subunit